MAKREGKVCIDVSSIQLGSNCPLCNKRSFKHHSYYVRRFLDLPVLGNETWIWLKARKFYCTTDDCPKKVFTERFDIHFKSCKRMTDKVRDKLLKVAFLMGGNGGEKICHLLNMPVSSSTLIRSLHAEPIPEIQASTIIGLDDMAYRKGRKYGTVLVDLEKQKIIDLLPDRESSTVEKWLRDHPQIKIVSRDRYVNYAIGINKALPEAIHVADRWHLIKNLGEVVKKVLDRVRIALKQKAKMLYVPQYSTPLSRASLPTRTMQSLE